MVDTGSGGLCCLIVAVFEVDGADHADFRVPSSAVDAGRKMGGREWGAVRLLKPSRPVRAARLVPHLLAAVGVVG
jgi:hypothetical protein